MAGIDLTWAVVVGAAGSLLLGVLGNLLTPLVRGAGFTVFRSWRTWRSSVAGYRLARIEAYELQPLLRTAEIARCRFISTMGVLLAVLLLLLFQEAKSFGSTLVVLILGLAIVALSSAIILFFEAASLDEEGRHARLAYMQARQGLASVSIDQEAARTALRRTRRAYGLTPSDDPDMAVERLNSLRPVEGLT